VTNVKRILHSPQKRVQLRLCHRRARANKHILRKAKHRTPYLNRDRRLQAREIRFEESHDRDSAAVSYDAVIGHIGSCCSLGLDRAALLRHDALANDLYNLLCTRRERVDTVKDRLVGNVLRVPRPHRYAPNNDLAHLRLAHLLQDLSSTIADLVRHRLSC